MKYTGEYFPTSNMTDIIEAKYNLLGIATWHKRKNIRMDESVIWTLSIIPSVGFLCCCTAI